MKKKYVYSNEILNRLAKILNAPNSFLKSSNKKQQQISNKVKEVSILSEYSLFYYENKNNIKKSLKKLNFKGLNNFSNILKNRLFEKIERENSVKINNQFKKVVKASIDLLTSEDITLSLSDNSFNLLLNNLDIDELFFYVLSTTVSCVEYKNHDSYERIGENSVDLSILFYKLRETIFKYILIEIFKVNKVLGKEFIIIKFTKNIVNILNSSKFSNLTNLVKQIEDIFIFSLELNKKQIVIKDKKYLRNFIIIPESIVNSFIHYSHLPEIVEPTDWDDTELNQYMKNLKDVKNGASTTRVSADVKNILSNLQKKTFRINQSAIDLFRMLDSETDDSFLNMLPFTPYAILESKKKEIDSIENEIGEDLLNKINNCYKNLFRENKTLPDNYKDYIVKELNIEKSVIDRQEIYYKLKKDLNKRCKLRLIHNTMIKCAEIYKGYPIYYINSMDYRTRMYPFSWMFNRTSGVYKYLLSEFSYVRLTNKGLENILSAYYYNFKDEYNDFINFSRKIIDDKSYHFKVKVFFKKVDDSKIKKIKSYFYVKILEMEIDKIFKNGFKTNIMIEIDQKSSSSVFLSIILGNKKLAEVSNVIEGDIKDPSKMLMERSKAFFKSIKGITDSDLNKLASIRNIHKYVFMCYCYNEKESSRTKKIMKYGDFDYDIASKISKEYQSFLNSVFNNLNNQIDKLNNIVKFIIKENKCINIKTIDGCILNWVIYKKNTISSSKKKFFSHVSNKMISFHVNTYNVENIDNGKMINGFLPNLIHSIDGSVMRIISKEIIKKGYIINHLHDSIQTHPNNLNMVYAAIKEVYSSGTFNNFLDDNVFNVMRSSLLKEKQNEFDRLVNDFKTEYKEIEIDYNTFSPENMYPFE